MAKVIGVGGVFFKSKDSGALTKWYSEVLGMQLEDWGGIVLRPEAMASHPGAATVFSPFKHDTDYFSPSTKEFMINLAVDDLDGILANFPEEANGKFAHIMDPEGNKIELWQPMPMG